MAHGHRSGPRHRIGMRSLRALRLVGAAAGVAAADPPRPRLRRLRLPGTRRCRIRNFACRSCRPSPRAARAPTSRARCTRNSEVEPYVAVNPVNAANLVGVWQQDRWSSGGARGRAGRRLRSMAAARGRTSMARVFALHRRQRGQRRRLRSARPTRGSRSAPTASPTRSAIAFSGAANAPGSSSAIARQPIARRRAHLGEPVTLIRDGPDNFNDKDSITADPASARLRVCGVGPAVRRGPRADAIFAARPMADSTWEARASDLRSGTHEPDDQQSDRRVDATARSSPSSPSSTTPAAGTTTATLAVDPLDRQGRRRGRVASWCRRCSRSARAIRESGTLDPRRHEPRRDRRRPARRSRRRLAGCALLRRRARRQSRCRARPTAASRGRSPARVNRDPSVHAFEPAVDDTRRRHDRSHLLRLAQQHGGSGDAADRLLDRALDRRRHAGARAGWPAPSISRPRRSREGLFLGDYQALVASAICSCRSTRRRTAPISATAPTSSLRS